MKQKYLTQEEVQNILKDRPRYIYKDFSLDGLRESLNTYFYEKQSQSERRITLYPMSKAAYDMFHEAMKKEAERLGITYKK